eukprot:CAMPEP_0198283324 /NCGR_PEP_ID=MMETSP1449-20131203/2958_1 /TAXON_ID=420275 /ORGANISM="Attheya septentrionalis, Strain CCMP2084" /LENGTH=1153 /DNA_ID=CAMNT_0043979907 /DNA_START=204 /DNA_END=3665 /DNA_ORIENTATION=+
MEMMGWKSSHGAKDGTSKSNMSDAASRQVNSNLQGPSGRRASKNSNQSYERKHRGSGSSHDDKRRTSWEKAKRGSGSSHGGTSHPSHHTRQHDNARKQPSKLSIWWSSVAPGLGRFFCFPFRISVEGVLFLRTILKSRVYNALLFVFTILLLFGSPLQTIIFNKNADPVFDVFYLVGFGVFCVDIIMRSYAFKGYFVFQVCGQNCRGGPTTPGGSFHLGSFIFWCDVISNFTFLTDVTFIFQAYYSIKKYEIELNIAGIPFGWGEVNRAIPVEFVPSVLIVIARTARIARYIRSWAVVKSSSRLNAYWIMQRINPFFYIDKCCRDPPPQDSSEKDRTDSNNVTAPAVGPGAMRRQNSQNSIVSSSKISRHASIQTSMASGESTTGNGVRFRSVLRRLGLKTKAEEEAERQAAARLIQRAFKAWNKRAKKSNAQVKNGGNKDDTSVKRAPMATFTKRKNESQVGSAMRELTGKRVAVGIMLALILTVVLTYSEQDSTEPSTMVVLHTQTQNSQFEQLALESARASSVPELYQYQDIYGNVTNFVIEGNPEDLREWEKLRVIINDIKNQSSTGYFSNYRDVRDGAIVELIATIFILFIWFLGVKAFAGPVMTLVVIPIERMIRLLTMLMRDPLGYQSTPRYKRFVAEEDELTLNTRWTKDVLKGMETSFLMSTILRIGSLLKVGFGSAGVEIIRNNLEKGHKKDVLFMNSQGSTVNCIFLFCDIRQFTDATECLQEEVFVFTNKVAAVVHSICHSYGGMANKNIGDAFLLSWLLDSSEQNSSMGESNLLPFTSSPSSGFGGYGGHNDHLICRNNEADKALLSVVKICCALHHDKYYLESLGETRRKALLKKLSKRKGPVVQMGIGMHAGKAVQGAIGSQRKLDATYVSEHVELAEYLESSTKRYGVKCLMSAAFHRLLNPTNQRRCRKVDQVLLSADDEELSDDGEMDEGDIMELYTYDMDIEALWVKPSEGSTKASKPEATSESQDVRPKMQKAKSGRNGDQPALKKTIRRQFSVFGIGIGKPLSSSVVEERTSSVRAPGMDGTDRSKGVDGAEDKKPHRRELVLPTGPQMYSQKVWLTDDMRKIRNKYSDGLFFQNYKSGLNSFYSRDWDHAKQCFESQLNERFEDGPSRYFLEKIQEHNGIPPRNFTGYGKG